MRETGMRKKGAPSEDDMFREIAFTDPALSRVIIDLA
jgi:hypothetical protein